MFESHCDHLMGRPGLYFEEMAVFLYDKFGISASSSSIKRALSSAGWTKRKPSKKQMDGILIYEISTSIKYLNFIHSLR